MPPGRLRDYFPVPSYSGRGWGVLILVSLSDGPQRWSGLRRRADGISEKMLAQTLKHWKRTGSSPALPSPSFRPGLTTASPAVASNWRRC